MRNCQPPGVRMPESFDPYRVWLSIPPESRPPTHYQLLGVSPDEHDPTVINRAVVRQSAYVWDLQVGKNASSDEDVPCYGDAAITS
ncbi:MAG TPA: hypothetical protein VJ783_10930 [Pirellulales bacterium]|nr:hypothetical protein [Pirellulales bacterium]